MRKLMISSLLAAVLLVLLLALPALAQGITNFTTIIASGDITAGDDLTVSDDLTVGDDTALGGHLAHTPGTTIVVTNGGTITPVSAHVPLSSTGSVGTASIAGPTAGRVIFLVNLANTTITLTDTGTLKLAGNAALGQYDTLTLRGDGTNWIEAARSNN